MAHPRKFRFGVQLHSASDGESWADMARRAEDLGYSTMFMPDHFGDQFAPVPALMAAADATTDLRVGSLVLDNDYKHPVVLAKEAATLDVLSGGRLELGLGAGWMNSDYEQSGIQHDPAKVRVDRMEEAITVLKGLFGEGETDFDGEHYAISGLDGQPKPVQEPMPLLIGGGAKRVLGIAGREATIVGINPTIRSGEVDADAARSGAADETDRKVEWIKAGAGSRFDDLELNMLQFQVTVTDDRDTVAEQMAPFFGVEPDEVTDYPHVLVGTVDQISDDLQRRRDRWGVSYFTVQATAMDDIAPVVARLAGE